MVNVRIEDCTPRRQCIVLIDMTTFKEYRNKENGLEIKCKLSASPSLYIFRVYHSHVLLPMMHLRGAGVQIILHVGHYIPP